MWDIMKEVQDKELSIVWGFSKSKIKYITKGKETGVKER